MNTESLYENFRTRLGQVDLQVNEIEDLMSKDFSLMNMKGIDMPFPSNIIIIGCGGTGGWLTPKLVKIVNDACSKRLISGRVNLLFADGDIVEEKNLIRQNFVAQDIGKNKAQVIAERYGVHIASNITVGYLDTYLVDDDYKIPAEHKEMFTKLSKIDVLNNGQDALIINLIDNAKTRKLVHDTAMNRAMNRSSTWHILDVGNNEYNGQLVYSNYKVKNLSMVNSLYYSQLGEQLDENDDISVFSCADADAEAVDQMFNANDFAATVAGNYINSWITDSKLKYGRVDFVTGSGLSVTKKAPLLPMSDLYHYARHGFENFHDSLASVSPSECLGETRVCKAIIDNFSKQWICDLFDNFSTLVRSKTFYSNVLKQSRA